MRKNRLSYRSLGKTGAALFGAIAMAAVCASPRTQSADLSVTWYTDSTFQTINVTTPIRDQTGWRAVLHDSWGKLDSFPMNDGSYVNSCQQLFQAHKKGLKVWTKAEDERIEKVDHLQFVSTQAPSEKAYVGTSMSCYAAREILHAITPRTSYLARFKMDARDARDLPAALFIVISDFETEKIRRATLKGLTLGEVVGPGATFADEANPRGDAPMVRVNNGYGVVENISLLARGDFNHDGLEDVLIGISSRAVGNSPYTSNDLYLVSRLAPNAPMKVLKTYPDLELGIPTF